MSWGCGLPVAGYPPPADSGCKIHHSGLQIYGATPSICNLQSKIYNLHLQGCILKIIVPFIIMLCFVSSSPAQAEDFPSRVEKPVDRSITIRQVTQKAEDRWEDQRRKLTVEYERLEAEQKRLAAHRDKLRQEANALERTVASLEKQLGDISQISAELSPFLEQTYRQLAELIETDTPFLMDERNTRLKHLRQTLNDPLVATGEKFRKIMEALFVEAEYGNTVEIYREKIALDGRKILADIFRLGRISLFFKTLDGGTAGHWNPASGSWTILPETTIRPIQDAMEMAAKRRSVAVVSLPVGRIGTP